MKRKTPAPLAEVIMTRQPEVIAHLEEMLRVKRTVPAENQAPHVRDRSEAEMAAFVNGFNACLEVVMHEFNCYAGFHNYGLPKTSEKHLGTARHQVAPGDPEFEEWRKLYYTNGIAKR